MQETPGEALIVKIGSLFTVNNCMTVESLQGIQNPQNVFVSFKRKSHSGKIIFAEFPDVGLCHAWRVFDVQIPNGRKFRPVRSLGKEKV